CDFRNRVRRSRPHARKWRLLRRPVGIPSPLNSTARYLYTGPKPMPKARQELATLSKRTRIGRSAAVNHFMAAADRLKFRGLASFLPKNLWPWIVNYLKFIFTPRHRFMDYTGSPKNARYATAPAPGESAIRIAL